VILVDSSVWIAHLRGQRTQATAKLEAVAGREPLLIGDLILLEVLQGARTEAHAARIERGLRRYTAVPLLSADLAPRAARNYRRLRELGVKTADIIIGTFCIENRHALLHDDRDFVPMEQHLGLVVVSAAVASYHLDGISGSLLPARLRGGASSGSRGGGRSGHSGGASGLRSPDLLAREQAFL
jgi:predicted nucleic acid-binding protein